MDFAGGSQATLHFFSLHQDLAWPNSGQGFSWPRCGGSLLSSQQFHVVSVLKSASMSKKTKVDGDDTQAACEELQKVQKQAPEDIR